MDYSSSEEREPIDDCSDAEEDDERRQSSIAVASEVVGTEKDPCLGMEFASDTDARAAYTAYAQRLGFGIRIARSRREKRKGVDVLVMKRFVCLKEGKHKKAVECDDRHSKKRNRLSIRDGCPAMMEVALKGPGKWVVTKLVLDHSHAIVTQELQKPNFAIGIKKHEEHLDVVRNKVFGDGELQCLLDYFKRMQVQSPGFFYAVQNDTRNCIKNVVWFDTKARIAYTYFGDVVYFDTTYGQNSSMAPFAALTGINCHGDPIVFGCALILDKTESSYTWLFQTWLRAMANREPVSLRTDQDRKIVTAVKKVFRHSFHCLCRWRILSRCKKRLADVYSKFPTLHHDLKSCVNESDTVELFEMIWTSIVKKHDLSDNAWLQRIYNIRQKWVPAYLNNSFFAELSMTEKGESLNRFHRRCFNTRVSLQAFMAKLDETLELRYLKEELNDAASVSLDQMLKTDTVIEKQAATIYTPAAFGCFQSELIESLHYYLVKIQDIPYAKFFVKKMQDDHDRHAVHLNIAENKACCNCCRFAFSGILCRHILRVFFLTGIVILPDHYITNRWTKYAKVGKGLVGQNCGFENSIQESSLSRYNDLVRDAMKCVEKGAISAENFKVAKTIIQKSILEIEGLDEKLVRNKMVPAESSQ